MSVINAYNLGMGFLDEILFSNATFDIEENDRVGLIGANGTGKTTLFKLISGEYEPTDGSLFLSKNTKIAFAEQFACENSEKTTHDELESVFDYLKDTETELLNLHIEIDKNPTEELIIKQNRLTEFFQNNGGLTFRSMVNSTLTGLGFTEKEFTVPVSKLSGGQRTKLALGKLLLSNANLLLLDEPTNHLDIKSVEWLEDFIKKYKGTLIIISHDRYFLDRVTNKTMEIRHKKVSLKKGNYSTYIKLRDEQIESDKRHFENQSAEIKRIEGIIEQQKRFNRERNYIIIASKQKQIERLKADLPEIDKNIEPIHLKFTSDTESGNEVIIADNVSKSFGEKNIFSNVNIDIRKNQKVFLIGPNGCGKTTLLKTLTGRYTTDSGYCRFGANVKPGYFDQNQDGLSTQKTVLDEVYDRFPYYTITELRNRLAGFLFKGEDINKKMCDLSGGERARIALLELSFTHPNLLLLDEPTNHLDIESREKLENALEDYNGTILCVSHDRYFINRLATQILYFDGYEIKKFDGTYDDYLLTLSDEKETVIKEKKPNEYKLRKERESNERKKQTRIKKIEEEISFIDEEKNQVQLLLNENTSDYEKILEFTNKMNELIKKQDTLFEEWELLSD